MPSTLRKLESRSLGVKIAEAYSEPCQISEIALFAKLVFNSV